MSVGECVRIGPVSTYGFGYWWDCEVTVTLPDGRQTSTTVRRSTVTPEDRDRPVQLVGRCDGAELERCAFTRNGNLFLGILHWLAALLVAVLAAVVAVAGGSALLVALLGPDLVERWFGRWSRRPAAAGPVPVRGAPAELPAGTGVLRIGFGYPERLAPMYEQSRPRLRINGEEVTAADWSALTCPLTPGPHRLRVSTVLDGGMEIGAVRQTVRVSDGVETVVGYEAPDGLVAPGVLRTAPGGESAQDEPEGRPGTIFQVSFGRLLLAVVPLNLVLLCLLAEFL
ncbi:DUF6346 domain-containing protein [Plantactinospora veratri]